MTRVDGLARSIGDLQDIVRLLKSKGIALRATEQPIDTGTAAGKAFLDMLGVFAEGNSIAILPRDRARRLARSPTRSSTPTKVCMTIGSKVYVKPACRSECDPIH